MRSRILRLGTAVALIALLVPGSALAGEHVPVEDPVIRLHAVMPDLRVEPMVPESEWQLPVTSPAACTASSHAVLIGRRLPDGPIRWRINLAGKPSNMRSTAAKDAIKRAFAGILQTRTTNNPDCTRYGDVVVGVTGSYLGETALGSGVTASGGIDATLLGDGMNVVEFGPISTGALALAATSSRPSRGIVEWGIRINTDYTWRASTDCSGYKFVLEDVMSHEFAHVFGLGDVGGLNAKNLTMYGATGPCETKRMTLGKGDIIGLRKLYSNPVGYVAPSSVAIEDDRVFGCPAGWTCVD